MKTKIIKILQFAVFLLIGIALLYFAFRGTDLKAMMQDLKKANYAWVMLALTIAIMSHYIRALRWKLLIEPLGHKPSNSNVFWAVMFGYFANLAAPRLGEVSKCGALNRTEKIPMDSLLGTVIVERAVDLISLIILTVMVFFLRFELFGGFIIENIYQPLSEKFLNIFPSTSWILFIFILSLVILFVLYRIRRVFSGSLIYQKIRGIAKGVLIGISSVYRMKRARSFVAYSIFLWILYFFMTWVMVFSIPETSSLNMIDGVFLLVIGSFGMTAPVQGGIGAYHWIISRGMTIFDIPADKGLVYATITHESQLVMILLFGIISMIYIGINRKKS